MKCEECGVEVRLQANFCQECGSSLGQPEIKIVIVEDDSLLRRRPMDFMVLGLIGALVVAIIGFVLYRMGYRGQTGE